MMEKIKMLLSILRSGKEGASKTNSGGSNLSKQNGSQQISSQSNNRKILFRLVCFQLLFVDGLVMLLVMVVGKHETLAVIDFVKYFIGATLVELVGLIKVSSR